MRMMMIKGDREGRERRVMERERRRQSIGPKISTVKESSILRKLELYLNWSVHSFFLSFLSSSSKYDFEEGYEKRGEK